jgi:hypothetical protein
MKLQDWANENEPSDTMKWKRGYWDQVCFIRDQVGYLLLGYEEAREKILVINTHVSKSIKLPVFYIDLKEWYGLELILRYNFFDWKVTVKSDFDIDCDFMDLFTENESINYLYCEGMENEVYGMFKENNKEFTVEISDQFKLFNFLWILKNSFK